MASPRHGYTDETASLVCAEADPRADDPYPALVFESQSTAVVVLSGEGEVLALNPAAESLFGVSRRQAAGMGLARLSAGAEGGPGGLADLVRQALERGRSVVGRDIPLGLPGERELRVDCTATPVAEAPGPTRILLELTGSEHHTRMVRDEDLITRNEIARAMVRGLAHEIRNPLGGLRGAAQLLERALPDPELGEYTRVIIAEADRLQELVGRLLGPRMAPRRIPVVIHEVTERACALTGAEAPPGVRIERDYDPSIPELTGDPELLVQALLNLTRNAVQAVGEKGRILIRTRVQHNALIRGRLHRLAARIDVVDDGPGIDPEVADSLFYPMVTGRAEGTGLGLSIAQSLIVQHEGIVECRSQAGETVFSILLPLKSM